MARFTTSLAFPLVVALTACNQGNFAGGSGATKNASAGATKPANNGEGGADADGKDGGPDGGLGGSAPGTDGGEGSDGDGDSGSDVAGAKPDDSGLLVDADGSTCVKDLIPVHVVFALDTTYSMDTQIAAVADNIARFATSLEGLDVPGTSKKIPSVKVGAVAYVDAPSDNLVLDLEDPASFAAKVRALTIRGGVNDHCEGGLQAAHKALQMLSGSGNAFKVLVVVSDNYSHEGGGADGNRTFSTSSLETDAKSKSLRHMMLFDSVPSTTNVPTITQCNVPSGTPADQWTPVRKAWRAAHAKVKADPGQNLPFPFGADTLSSQLPNAIAKLIKVCH